MTVAKRLKVNLSNGSFEKDEVPREWVLNRGGGTGLALEAFFARRATSRQNCLLVAPGLMSGTNAPAGHWCSMVACKPDSERVAVSYFGGHFGISLRLAGIALLEIEGQASSMTTVVIEDGHVRFVNGNSFSGLSPYQTFRRLEDLLGPGYHMATIGLAGELGIPMASVLFDGTYQNRSGGFGAQFGGMRLKAVAVKGTGRVVPALPELFYREGRRLRECFGQHLFPFRELSSSAAAWFIERLHREAMLPIRNFSTSSLPGLHMFTGELSREALRGQPVACFGCPVGCRSTIFTNGICLESPNLEETIALGTLCGISDVKDILEIKGRCDQLGLDPLVMGGIIASFMERVATQHEVSFSFGEGKSVLKLLEEKDPKTILMKLGVSSDMNGWTASSNASFAGFMNTDPRADDNLALSRIVWPLEEAHVLSSSAFLTDLPVYGNRGREIGVGRSVKMFQEFYLGLQSLGFCPFVLLTFGPRELDVLLKAALGEDVPNDATSHLGRKVLNSEIIGSSFRHLNYPQSEGFGKLAAEPIADGLKKGKTLDLCRFYRDYSAL